MALVQAVVRNITSAKRMRKRRLGKAMNVSVRAPARRAHTHSNSIAKGRVGQAGAGLSGVAKPKPSFCLAGRDFINLGSKEQLEQHGIKVLVFNLLLKNAERALDRHSLFIRPI